MARDDKILKASFEMFMRYGVKATSMAQIAEAAEVSRQTLYNSFGSKEDILRALIRWHYADAISKLSLTFEETSAVDKRLDRIFDVVAREPFALMRQSPNSNDFISGINAASRDEIATGASEVQQKIAEAITGHVPKNKELALSRVIFYAIKSAKENAQDADDLESLLNALRGMIALSSE